MPTYDYACRFCDHTFEYFQGINEAHLRKCPECGRHGLKRLFGVGAGVVFKGSGFYETDYKRKESTSGKPAAETSGNSSGKDGKDGKDASDPAGKGGEDKKPEKTEKTGKDGPSGDKPA